MKFYVGAFLTGLGVILIYESIALRLIDAILFLGILLLIIGAILLLSAFLEEYYGYRLSKEFSNIAEYKSRYIDGRNYAIGSNIKDSFLGSSGLNSNYYETPVLCPYGVREERSKASFFGPTRQEAESREYRRPVRSPKRKQNSRPVLRTRPSFDDEKGSAHNKENRFRTPSKKYVESDNKHHVLRVRKDYDENKGIPSLKDLNFTPNYEKPMRITRRPRRKSPDKIDINNIPQRVQDSKSLEDKISFLGLDESQLLEPPRERTFEEIAEDVIVPIHTSEDDVIIPIYNDTNYNVTYAGYDYETDMVEYGYTNSIQEPVHVVEVYDSFDNIVVEHNSTPDDNLPYDKEFVIDDIEDDVEEDKYVPSEFVKAVKSRQTTLETPTPKETPIIPLVTQESPIQIDPNNPESLPIPKLLNSFVICEKGILTSKDAFEEVATHAKSEILLEAPDIRDMGDVFLSALSKVNSRIIIQDFDTDDLPYVLLISSLLKSGIQIKTAPVIEAFNLIGDYSHALIISNDVEEDVEYGAVFDDEEDVKAIKELFETSWNLAKDLDYIN